VSHEFPCAPLGHVDLDSYDHQTRWLYLYVRALRGLDYSLPRMVILKGRAGFTGTYGRPQSNEPRCERQP